MAGAARKKIDPQTLQLFDLEVDHPDHDVILTNLFRDDDRLLRLIKRLHGLQDLVQPQESDKFDVWDLYKNSSPGGPRNVVTWQQAVELGGGVPPQWQSLSPVRNFTKRLEVPLEIGDRYPRVVGFIDMCLSYAIVGSLYLVKDHSGKHSWHSDKKSCFLYIEVKSKWPTAGNLLRQLNLYGKCVSSSSDSGVTRTKLVVGPDESMNDLVEAHGWRLVNFKADLSEFWLVPRTKKQSPKETAVPNQF